MNPRTPVSLPPSLLGAIVAALLLLVARSGAAQAPCARECDASLRDAYGCCPAAPRRQAPPAASPATVVAPPPPTAGNASTTRPTYPERFCLLDQNTGGAMGCFPDMDRCRAKEAELTPLMPTTPPRCARIEEVACYVRDDGAETCAPTLELCREYLWVDQHTHRIPRGCAIQNRSVGIPRTAPAWEPPRGRVCMNDASSVVPTSCSPFQEQCERTLAVIRRFQPNTPNTCRHYDQLFCATSAQGGEVCGETIDQCHAAEYAYGKSMKLTEGCVLQAPGITSEKVPPNWTPGDVRICLKNETSVQDCYLFDFDCQKMKTTFEASNLHGYQCARVDSPFCYTNGEGHRLCRPTLDECRQFEQVMSKVNLPTIAPVEGCSRGGGSTWQPGVPRWTAQGGRTCLFQDGKFAGHCHVFPHECENQRASMASAIKSATWSCKFVDPVYCSLQKDGTADCSASLDSCRDHALTLANAPESIRPVTGCAPQGEGLPYETTPIWTPPEGRFCQVEDPPRSPDRYASCDYVTAEKCVDATQRTQRRCAFYPQVACFTWQKDSSTRTDCYGSMAQCESANMHQYASVPCALRGVPGEPQPLPGQPPLTPLAGFAAPMPLAPMVMVSPGVKRGGGCSVERGPVGVGGRVAVFALAALAVARRRRRRG